MTPISRSQQIRMQPWLRSIAVVVVITQILAVYPLPMVIAETTAEIGAERRAAERARQDRTEIAAKLPVGQQHARASELVRATVKRALAELAAGQDAEQPVEDLIVLGEKLRQITLRTIAEWSATQAKLVERKSPDRILERHEQFRRNFVAKSQELSRLIGLVERNRSRPERLREQLDQLARFLAPAAASDPAPEAQRLPHRGAQLDAPGPRVSSWFSGWGALSIPSLWERHSCRDSAINQQPVAPTTESGLPQVLSKDWWCDQGAPQSPADRQDACPTLILMQNPESTLKRELRTPDFQGFAGVWSSSFSLLRANQRVLQQHPTFSPFLLAAAGDVITGLLTNLTVPSVTGAPTAADLAPTEDIVLSTEIVALAAQLGNDPVKIFEYVRNELAYEPYFGSVKGAAKTLADKAGNDMDIASALMALLRASGIPCRYVFGTIELSAAEAGDWVGVHDPQQAANVFINNGIPVEFDTAGGTVGTLRLDHVWVKAYVDYFPYRGPNVLQPADTWIELDGSFKQHTFTTRRDIETAVGINPRSLLINATASSTVDPAGQYATHVPEAFILNELFSLAGPIRDYLAANDLTTVTVFGQRIVSEERFGILPVADQYKITARGMNFAALPAELRQTLTIGLQHSSTPALQYSASLPGLADKRLTLSYRPETAADEQVVADYAASTEFPAYLVSVVPELRVDGQLVATGTPIGHGQTQELSLTFVALDGSTETVTDTVTAGGYHALVLDYQNVGGHALDRQRTLLALAEIDLQSAISVDRERTIGDVLHALGLSYFHQIDRFNQITAGSLEVAATRVPSVVRVSWDLTVTHQFGLPFTATANRLVVDVGRDVHVPVAINRQDLPAENQFAFTAALTGSALEHNVLMQAFTPEAASTVRVIQAANADGIKIYTVTAANAAAVTPLLNLPAAAVSDILDAVNAGLEVTVPESPVSINGVSHYGYIKRDLDTSASDFVLDGLSGGQQINPSLTTADLLQESGASFQLAASRFLSIVTPVASWLRVAEDATTSAGLSYLPAITSINAWYQNRTSLDPVTTIAAAIAVSGPITRISVEPAILNVVAAPELISPNGDGRNDALRIQADVTRNAVWTATIRNAQNQSVFSTSGSTPTLDVTFNQLVPDGSYKMELTAVAGAVQALPVTASFRVDATPPTALITSPTNTPSVTDALTIRGTADDLNFHAYTVSIQPNGGASILLASASEPQIDRTLAVVDTRAFPNGTAQVILAVEDQAGNSATSTVSVVINNPVPDTTPPTVTLTALNPADNQPITAATPPVSGTIPVTVNASDDRGVARLQLFVDGQLVAQNTNSVTLSAGVNTAFLADGSHTLLAKAFDTSLNEAFVSFVLFVASPISNFKITPTIARPSQPTLSISATLQQAANWTLSFSGPATIPNITGSGTTVSGQVSGPSYTDGNYTVTLTVAGVAEPPSLPFAIDIVDSPPVAAIANLTSSNDPLSPETPVLREGFFTLTGTADDADTTDTVSYTVALYRPDDPVTPVKQLLSQTGRVPATGTLGLLDFTLVENGVYDLVLTVNSLPSFQSSTASVRIALDSQLKVGQFSFSQQDLVIPVSGIPLTVIRTYNSLRAGGSGIPAATGTDFGPGWTYSISDIEMSVDEDRQMTTDLFGETFSQRVGGGRNVTLTLPDGRRATFRFGLESAGNFQYRATWTPPPGVYYTLKPTVDDRLIALFNLPPYWQAAGLETPLDAYDFPAFILTAKDGTQYRIERENLGEHFVLDEFGQDSFVHAYGQAKLKRITDRAGNRIEFSQDRIDHFNPSNVLTKSVLFQRDAQGRITAIYDPNQQTSVPAVASVVYEYDALGNLIKASRLIDKTVNPPVYLTTEYVYGNAAFPHYITSIVDPRGLTPMRTEYDAAGRIIATIDAFGNRIALNHDLANRTETIYDRQGNPTVHVYDDRGNVIQTVDAQGHVTRRTYDANDNELTVTDPLGNTARYSYDSAGNRTSVSDPVGSTTTFTYDGFGNVLTTTDPRGNVTRNTYDGAGNLTRAQDALGNITEFTYDAAGNRTTEKDALGQVTSYQYDAAGNLLQLTDPLGHSTSYSYDANGNQLTETTTRTTPSGLETLVTSHLYDAEDRIVASIDPLGFTNRVVYNEIGKTAAASDKLGRQTTYDYNERGELVRTTFPDNTAEEITYDPNGRRLSSKDRAARVTTYTYDSVGRPVRTTYPDAAISTTSYDAAGRVIAVTDSRGNVTQYGYDAGGRRVLVRDALGRETTFAHDANGNQVAFTDALGRRTESVYDALNRRIRVVYPDGTVQVTTYDALGRRAGETDQANVTTRFAYDALGRLTAVTNALSQVTAYTYDELGLLTTQTDANNHTTRFEYDKLGRRTKRILPLGQVETLAYDAVGNALSRSDFNGRTTTFAYDAMNRLLSKTPDPAFGASAVMFTYHPSGLRSNMTDAVGVTDYTYDNRDRLIRKSTPQGTLNYEHDAQGDLTRIHSSTLNGIDVSYVHDALNRLSRVTDANVGETAYVYDEVGNLQSYTYPNGLTHGYQYNALNRLTNLNVQAQSGTLASYTYTLGAAGNRTAVAETLQSQQRTVTYAYDSVYRLLGETITDTVGPSGAISYAYDPVGNRLSRTSSVSGLASAVSSYDANDRLTTDTYDANGNTVASGANTDAYDFENRLVSRNNGQVQIAYDGVGHRVRQTVGGVTTWFLVDDRNPTGYAQVLEELQNGVLVRTYTYGHDLIAQDQLLGTQWTASFYGYDGHGNVRQLYDETGVVTDTYSYEAFGTLIHQTGTTPNNYLYTGEQYDPNLGFYYLRARYLNPATGRFWTMDSYEGAHSDPASLHKYLYANADPLNRLDPSGHVSLLEIQVVQFFINILVTEDLQQGRGALNAARSKFGTSKELEAAITTLQLVEEAQTVIAIAQISYGLARMTKALWPALKQFPNTIKSLVAFFKAGPKLLDDFQYGRYYTLRNILRKAGGAADEDLHHMVEVRFWQRLGFASEQAARREWEVVVFAHPNHVEITQSLRQRIGYGTQTGTYGVSTSTATLQDVWNAHKDVYTEFGVEVWLEKIKPLFQNAPGGSSLVF